MILCVTTSACSLLHKHLSASIDAPPTGTQATLASLPQSVLHLQVNCNKLPEDKDNARYYNNKQLNCHRAARVPGPGGKYMVVCTPVACIQPAMLFVLLWTVLCSMPFALVGPRVYHQGMKPARM